MTNKQELVKKWSPIIDINESKSDNSVRENMAMLLEAQVRVNKNFMSENCKIDDSIDFLKVSLPLMVRAN